MALEMARLCELGTTFRQDFVECRKKMPQKVAILASVDDLDAVAHLSHQGLTLSNSCTQLHRDTLSFLAVSATARRTH